MGKYKNSNVEAPKEIIQLKGKYPKNEWWDEECRQVTTQKNRARMKCLQQKTTANKEQYKEKEAN